MKLYLEAKETPETADSEFIRVDVTGMDEAEKQAVKTDIEAIMAGKTYVLGEHLCRHDEGQSCEFVSV